MKLDLFRNRKNRYKPLVGSYKKLEKFVGNKQYFEAILFDLDSLAEFVDIIFWITRCDPSAAEYMFIFDADEKFQFTICKYGHIHLTEFKSETLTIENLTTHGWYIHSGQEVDSFSEGSKIAGRQLIV